LIKRIQVTNLGCFDSLDVELPAVTVVSGGNAAGKTTLLDCIKFVGDRGHDPDLIRGAADFGEVVLTLSEGNQIRARATRRETTRWWKPADGKRWIEGRDLIDKIYRAIAYDPIRFLELGPKEQAAKLLEIAPVEVEDAAIDVAVGDAELEAGLVNPQIEGLERIAAKSSNIYAARTAINTESRQLAAHAAQLEVGLRAALPDDRDWNAEREKVGDALAVKQAEELSEMTTLRSDFDAAKQAAIDGCTKAHIGIDARIDAAIRDLEKQRNSEKATATKVRDDCYESIRASANRQAADMKAKHAPEIQRLTTELTQAQTYATTQAQIVGTKKAIESARHESEAKAERSKALTAALDRLAALKTSLVSKFRIGGGYVEDGRIVREQDGGLVPLNRWNTADQVRFCLALGMKIGGNLVCCDHVESLDGKNEAGVIATAKKYAAESGVQFILAKVGEGPLVVEEGK
jgi:DNA repair exonuclease SbcCD ATPase subunit